MGRKSYYEEHRVAVLRAVEQCERAHGRPPTVRELATSQLVGVATMHEYLKRLSTEGLIQWSPKTHRSLRLTPQGSLLLSPPVQPSP